MVLLLNLARAYPSESLITLLALLIAGVMEGLSFSALLPLLSTAIGSPTDAKVNSVNDKSDGGLGPGEIVTDILSGMGVAPTIGVLLGVIVVGIVLKSGLLFLAKKQVGYTVAHVATDLRLSLLRALLFARWEYYLSQPVGNFANGVATEAHRASSSYLHGANMIVLVIQVIVYTIVAFLVSWQATLICLGASVALLLMLNRLVQMARRAGKRQTKVLKSLLTRLTDSLQSVKPLKTMARENMIGPLLEAETTRLNRAMQKQVLSTEGLRAAQEVLLTSLVAAGVYVVLTWWDLQLASVIVLILLLARMVSRLGKAQREYQRMKITESAYWSLQETIKTAEGQREEVTGGMSPSLKKDIRLDSVSFAYQKTPIIQDGCLSIPVGVLTVIVGPSGAGKTTIADLVTGLLRPQQGQVLIDDVPLEKVNLREWRRMIGYVPQETHLLHDTVFRNVEVGDPELNEKDVEGALRSAGAWDFVLALPQGMQSLVGERGATLSGGQRQRIAIARALVHQPSLLILDEATSALDPESEAGICKTLQALRGKLTILAISHQPALVDAADRVYSLQNGTITLLADGLAVGVTSGEPTRMASPKEREWSEPGE